MCPFLADSDDALSSENANAKSFEIETPAQWKTLLTVRDISLTRQLGISRVLEEDARLKGTGIRSTDGKGEDGNECEDGDGDGDEDEDEDDEA